MGYFWTANMGLLWTLKKEKKTGKAIHFSTFPTSFKKEIETADPMSIPTFLTAMSTLILLFLRHEITFWFYCGF
jgi:hypothetical protein